MTLIDGCQRVNLHSYIGEKEEGGGGRAVETSHSSYLTRVVTTLIIFYGTYRLAHLSVSDMIRFFFKFLLASKQVDCVSQVVVVAIFDEHQMSYLSVWPKIFSKVLSLSLPFK